MNHTTTLSALLFFTLPACSMIPAGITGSRKPAPAPAPASQPAATEDRGDWSAPAEGKPAAASTPAPPPEYRAAIDDDAKLALDFLDLIAAGTPPAFDGTDPFARKVQAIAKLDKVATVCKEPAVAAARPVPTGCSLAENRVALAKQYVEAVATDSSHELATKLQRNIEIVSKGERIEAHRHRSLTDPQAAMAEAKQRYDAMLAPLGAEVDAAVFQPIADASAGYAAVLVEAGKKSVWDPAWKHTDNEITVLVKRDHTKGPLDLGKVIKIGSPVSDWTVRRNDYGVILKKDRGNMNVLVQATGEAYCRLYTRDFEKVHDGAKYLKVDAVSGIRSFAIVGCH